MIVSFANVIPDAELDQFLKEMEQLMHDSGLIQTFAARRAIRVPGDVREGVVIRPCGGDRSGGPDPEMVASPMLSCAC